MSEPICGLFNCFQSLPVVSSGTGHSCIYALLGCRLHPTWRFTTTDVDPRAIECAEKNVTENRLDKRITCLLNPDRDKLLLPVLAPLASSEQSNVRGETRYDFCMCNPPFYESWEQVSDSRDLKEEEPSAVCLGTESEMVTAGGEVEFVRKLISESLLLRGNVRWFTTKLGIRSSLKDLTEELGRHHVS